MKPKICVVLEGPDCSGKSTAVQEVIRLLDSPTVLYHNGVYPDLTGNQLFDIYAEQISHAMTGSANVIMDRNWCSEVIYGALIRGEVRLTVEQLQDLDKMIAACGCGSGTILFTRDIEDLKREWSIRKSVEYVEQKEQFESVLMAYRYFDTNFPLEGLETCVNVFEDGPQAIADALSNLRKKGGV